MKKDFDITKTKLVIWDLDETFWDGTLSEGSIKFNPRASPTGRRSYAKRDYELYLFEK